MNLYFLSVPLLFIAAILLVMVSLEVRYHLRHRSRRKSEDEKDSPVGSIAGSVIGLVAFMMAFTFGIVADRYEARKSLVREEANSIGTTYLRADFLPQPDSEEAKTLLKEYVSNRLAFTDRIRSTGQLKQDEIGAAMERVSQIHGRLWQMAVANARLDMNSDVAALYIDSLNGLIDLHALRIAVALQTRIPAGIWATLVGLTVLGMVAVGYQMGIAGSRRSLVQPILAISFSLVIVLIATLDRPQGGYIKVSQQPFVDLLKSMI